MKKCPKCQIVYHTEFRTTCLYCDCGLVSVDVYDGLRAIGEGESEYERSIDRGAIGFEYLQYLLGSYFRIRSMPFYYMFSRQEYKKGEKYRRLLVQPLNYTAAIKIPWIFVNLIDTIFFRIFYHEYCPDCGYKYFRVAGEGHDPDECAYNKEYTAIVEAIRNGGIVKDEMKFRRESQEKIKQGKRSAYKDLCSRKTKFEFFLDVATITFSIGIIHYAIARSIMPIFAKVYQF